MTNWVQTDSLHLELSSKILQPNGEVLRATILQGPEQSLLLRSLDPAFEVAPVQCPILGLVCQQNCSVVQRKAYLLARQQVSE